MAPGPWQYRGSFIIFFFVKYFIFRSFIIMRLHLLLFSRLTRCGIVSCFLFMSVHFTSRRSKSGVKEAIVEVLLHSHDVVMYRQTSYLCTQKMNCLLLHQCLMISSCASVWLSRISIEARLMIARWCVDDWCVDHRLCHCPPKLGWPAGCLSISPKPRPNLLATSVVDGLWSPSLNILNQEIVGPERTVHWIYIRVIQFRGLVDSKSFADCRSLRHKRISGWQSHRPPSQ